MKETTKKYLKSIVDAFNKFADKEALDEMLIESSLLSSALEILRLEGIAEVKIIHDNPHKIFSTIHLIIIDKE